MKALADALTAILDLLQRLVLWIVLALLLLTPSSFPLLDRFVVETTEINLFGQKFKITDTRGVRNPAVPGLTIEGERVLLNGEDLNLLPGERDRYRLEAERLRRTNETLGRQLAGASQQLAALASEVRAAPPATQSALEALVQTTRAAAEAVPPAPASAPERPSTPSSGARIFAALLSSDTTLGQGGARDEIAKAEAWGRGNPPAPQVRVFLRNGYFATALVFDSREAAQQALPMLRQAFRLDAYVADLRTWCPAALGTEPRVQEGVPVTNCRF